MQAAQVAGQESDKRLMSWRKQQELAEQHRLKQQLMLQQQQQQMQASRTQAAPTPAQGFGPGNAAWGCRGASATGAAASGTTDGLLQVLMGGTSGHMMGSGGGGGGRAAAGGGAAGGIAAAGSEALKEAIKVRKESPTLPINCINVNLVVLMFHQNNHTHAALQGSCTPSTYYWQR